MNAPVDDAPSPSVMPGPRRPDVAFLVRHPAHFIALGAGSGLAPFAPGTFGTLWGWASFVALNLWWGGSRHADLIWGIVLVVGLAVGWWACTRAAQHLQVADPGAVVWDEILAIWLVLWFITPYGILGQTLGFILFRYFDAAKPGPIGWADGLFKLHRGESIGWAQGFGILFDDLVAALCTLLVLAAAVAMRQGGVTAGLMS
ncbi:phosphatidylglycerophosphatase A [Aquabacterium sp.]|uniref:phosphatidylglycerophosphatase A family protein n=1 Tax=Aquabacterium sp. TaxID=1872578 RepID=UPI0035AF6EF8